MKKYLRGHNKQYFSLAVIALYSTLHKLTRLDSNFEYFKLAFSLTPYKTAPPTQTA